MTNQAQQSPTAAILIVGDEILSGRTKDTNVSTIATFLAPLGIDVCEVRVVPDVQARIVTAVNALRADYDYVFSTGGIGPTHDDITADAIAAAFGVSIAERADALELLASRYGWEDLNDARRRMARIPEGASLIANPVSTAPGFQIGNVFVMAGVPNIMRAMLDDVGHRLRTGIAVENATWRAKGLREGILSAPLGQLAEDMPDVSFGSYPWSWTDDFGTNVVIRGRDKDRVALARAKALAVIQACGIEPEAT